MEQIRIIKEMRDESYKKLSMQGAVDSDRIIPRFMVWENVPGAFSSNNGEDFRAVLEETARVKDKDAAIPRLEGKQKWSPSGCIMGDGWSIAWRVHDAQFWGVPQRRKRIALVADFSGGVLQKYFLSAKACQGILRRAKTRGKQLPEILYKTLMKQAGVSVSKNEPDAMGG
jgi:DNA (cytosine-5)-methyltransferase 1